ncbi:cache domain-containing protein [Poseidonibacter lekithochrous]|uniref:sensor histidine kinase n=1 Tax=Poseidonibacter lekithochrous TaxID=1904463 RepID=UPI0008FC31FB|nr:cache domain-containing protein [Poseidonibacter lekithochrous]QKJ22454.1 Cache sensor-containing signal transduction histidine kinase [Poseidonibacter lekithochrous]
MNLKNEKQLLLVIRYTLPIFILFLSICITTFLYYENKSSFEKMKKNTEEKFISDKKEIVKNQVENIYKYIISEQVDTENALRQSLIKRIHESHKNIQNIYNQYKNTMNKEELRVLIKTTIKDIRFNSGRGYFFVYDKNAITQIHSLLPALEGKNLIDYQDSKGTFVLRESLELLKNKDESYQEWYWRKSPEDMTDYRKIGFVKNIYELDWFIGSGEYLDDFEKDIQKKVLSQISKFKFGENGYLVVIDKNNTYLNHAKKELIGKNVINKLNKWNKTDIMNKTRELSKNGGGFITLNYSKPNTNIPVTKISFTKYVENWDWIITTGFYKEDVDVLIKEQEVILEEQYSQNLQKVFIFALFITSVLLLITYFISIIIEKKFKSYKDDIKHHIKENQKQYELLAQKSKLAAMGEMMENIAHQWRQPLSLITTAASGIKFQKELDILSDEMLNDSIDSIGHSANHLSETIEDFRDFFKPNKEKSFFKLGDCIYKTFKLLSSQIQNKEIEIIEEIDNIEIDSFERELLQVLLNIINNAKDALSKIEEEKYIFIKIYKTEEDAVIEIKDNAGGIKENIIERIFEPYFTTKHKSQGTGLGLYMSEEIVSRHMEGSLEVENSEYEYKGNSFRGALFTIKLPLK